MHLIVLLGALQHCTCVLLIDFFFFFLGLFEEDLALLLGKAPV